MVYLSGSETVSASLLRVTPKSNPAVRLSHVISTIAESRKNTHNVKRLHILHIYIIPKHAANGTAGNEAKYK